MGLVVRLGGRSGDCTRLEVEELMVPTDWLTEHAALLPSDGAALDIACGGGRHAVWLAGHGLRVTALDRSVHPLVRATWAIASPASV